MSKMDERMNMAHLVRWCTYRTWWFFHIYVGSQKGNDNGILYDIAT